MSRIDAALKRVATGAGPVVPGVAGADAAGAPLALHEYPAESRADAPADPAEAAPRSAASTARRPVAPAPPAAAADPAFAAKLVTHPGFHSDHLEQYRRLAAALHQLHAERGLKLMLVSSALPGEGKTLLCANLALTLSRSFGRHVLLVDADLRRPSLHRVFGIDPAVGFTEHLRFARGPLPVVPIGDGLTLLPAGRPDPDAAAVLTSPRAQSALTDAAEQYDWVIIDSPPVGVMSDARLMADLVQGVLLVVAAGSTSYRVVEEAIDELGRDRVIGTVLNRVDQKALGPSGYGARTYRYATTEQA